MIRLGVLGSTRGTNLNAIVDAIDRSYLSASIEVIISNKSSALILEKAVKFGIKSEYVNPYGLNREEFDEQLTSLLKQHGIELVVLIGYMRILSPQFVLSWKDKIINIHPSLLPAFSGLMDLDVHRAVLESGESETGCTVHFVTEQVDSGPIILQKKCPVLIDDSPESLKARVQQLEGEAMIEAIQQIIRLNKKTEAFAHS